MSKGKRIVVLLGALALLFVVYLVVRTQLPSSSEISILIFTTLTMLSFTVLFVEHFFTTPTDVLANTISILLVLSPMRDQLHQMGVWYWIFFFYNLLLALASLLALLLVDSAKSTEVIQNKISSTLKYLAAHFGNGRFLYFVLFILTLLFYVDSQAQEFLILFAYSVVVLLINPKKPLSLIFWQKKHQLDVGRIIGVQSKNTFLAKLYNERPSLQCFDFVEFRYSMSEDERPLKGLIIDKYLLNEEQWIRILASEEIQCVLGAQEANQTLESNVVYKIEGAAAPELLNRYVGVVAEKSTIEKMRFEYGSRVPVSEGELLELSIGQNQVLYQVVQGITEAELLESKDEMGFIVGEAVQLGKWNSERRCFEKFGWVPDMNTPVYLASEIEPIELENGELQIGIIPNTNYPVIIDKIDAVTHHLGILGITGCGKSVLARHLIREIVSDGVKVICVDFTNEYGDKFPDHNPSPIVSKTDEGNLFEAIDKLSAELNEFPNKRNATVINNSEQVLRTVFFASMKDFLESDRSIALFELPDVSNTTGILEYTKWFFKILFEIARQHDNFGRRVCIVLEEAHTVIPEWRFIGVSEKMATALVNSIGQIALQGRKYNVGFVVIAQRTANVSKTVLTQCNTIIAFQQFDKTGSEFLANYMGSEMVSALPTLKFRQAIVVGKALRTGIPVIFEVPEITEPTEESRASPDSWPLIEEGPPFPEEEPYFSEEELAEQELPF